MEQSISTTHLNWLRFPDEVEARFHAHYFAHSIIIARVALALGLALISVFGALDVLATSSSLNVVWLIRYGVICPTFAVVLLLSFAPWFQRVMQPLLSIAVLIGGIGIAAMSGVSSPMEPAFYAYYVGLLLVIMWAYTFIRLRFWYALLSCLLIVVSYEFIALGYQNLLSSPQGLFAFVNNNFFFLSANIVAGFAGYFLERYARRDFWQRHTIEVEKAKSESLLKQQSEDALRAIVAGTATETGDAFFRSLAMQLAAALRVRYALVAEVVPAAVPTVHTLAFWQDAALVDNVDYALAGTPCAHVIAGDICYYPHQLQTHFPADTMLVDLHAESYVGAPLTDAKGNVVGHLAVMDTQPLHAMREEQCKATLQIFAARASAELERQRADVKVRESEARFRSLIENSTDGLSVLAVNGIIEYISPALERLVGYTAQEMLGQSFQPFIVPEDLPAVAAHFQNIIAHPGQAFTTEFRARRKDGSTVTLENVGQLWPNGQVISNSRDISNRKQAEEKLRESEERYRTLIETSDSGIAIVTAAGIIRYINPAYERTLGYSAAELIGQPYAAVIHPDDLAQAGAIFAQLFQDPTQPVQATVRAKHKDGRWRWLEGVARVMPDGNLVAYNRDVTEHKQAEENLRRLNEELEDRVEQRTAEVRRLADVIESTSDMVATVDLQGPLTYLNRAGRQLVGLNADADLRQFKLTDFYPPYALPIIQERIGRNIAQGIDADLFETVVRRADGQEVPVSIVGIIHRTPEGAPTLLSAVVRDISEQKRNEAELKAAKETAEAATRAKSEFLANMSHEIRTPMNAVIGMTSLLLDTPLNTKQREFVETIRTGGDSLLTIINDILDFSKIEAGKLTLENQPFDLRACVESALDLVAPRAAEKHLDLAYLIEAGTPAAIVGDVTRLRQVLVNLLSNAVKFTERGEVVVSVSTHNPQSAMLKHRFAVCNLQFAVRDTGIGIPADKMNRLFKMFSQVDASTTRVHGGTGLGLAISRSLSELMGGTMWVESDGAGQGATFHFTIVAEAAPAQPRAHLQALQPDLKGKRVLIVDDNATNRRILSLQAQTWGMMPYEAALPSEALELLQRGGTFDLAILDMHMPEMDGLALAAEIRTLEGRGHPTPTRTLPLVMLTSVSRQAAQLAAEFAAFLTKPVKPSQLYDVLVSLFADAETVIKLTRTTQELEPMPEMMTEPVALRILLAEDVVVNQKFAIHALEKMGYRADVVSNGVEAVAAAKRQPYDVILMDVQMPEMDGLEATQRIRQLNITQPRIIAMTANAMQGDREACLNAGMDDYISKPVYLKELRAALERAKPMANSEWRMANSNTRDQKPKANNQPTTNGQHAPSGAQFTTHNSQLTTTNIQAPSSNIQLLNAELIAAFSAEAPTILATLRAAIEQGNAKGVRMAAHSLKGSSNYLGAQRLAQLCSELEQQGRSGRLDEALGRLTQVEAEFKQVAEALAQKHM